jgi:hypothetical protein
MKRRLLLPILLVWMLFPAAAPGCNVPVFRYALERWRADRADDRYEVFVFHRGPLDSAEQAALDRLRGIGDDRHNPANCDVAAIDLTANLDHEVRELWESQKGATLPWVLVRFPASDEKRPPLWAGPLHSPVLVNLATSPARREIARRLMGGESIVWLLLEGGDAARDQAAADTLAAELARLEKEIKLPDQAGEPVKLLSNVPLALKFSVLRVARGDPKEQLLVATLTRAGKDFTPSKQPVVFPVFGRGRFLDGIAGREIKAEPLEDAASFLCGACSCVVKRLNPGADLLISADWDSILDERVDLEPIRVPEMVSVKTVHEEPKSTTSGPPAPPTFGIPRGVLIGAIAFAGLLAIVTGTLALRSRTPPSPDEPS